MSNTSLGAFSIVLSVLISILASLLLTSNEITLLKAHCYHSESLGAKDGSNVDYVGAIRPEAFATKDGLVLWTIANFSWFDFVLNWVDSVQRSNVTNFFVACLDDKVYHELNERSVPAIRFQATFSTDELAWGSKTFKQRGKEKVKFIMSMLDQGLQPLYSDLDVTWQQDPFPYVRTHPEAGVLISTDALNPLEFGGDLDKCPVEGNLPLGMLNVGLHLMRPAAKPLLQLWLEAMDNSDDMEQLALNKAVTNNLGSAAALDDSSRLCLVGENVTLGVLPCALFPSGHLHFTQGVKEWKRNQSPGIMAVHATYTAGRPEKRFLMRDKGLWQVDKPERFQPVGGFLSFDMEVPEELLQGAGPPADIGQRALRHNEALPHIALMRYQLHQAHS